MTNVELAGFAPAQVDLIHTALLKNYGAILVAGETGSGKRNSIRSMVKDYVELREKDGIGLSRTFVTEIAEMADNSIKGWLTGNCKPDGRASNSLSQLYSYGLTSDTVVYPEIFSREEAQYGLMLSNMGGRIFSTIHAPSAAHIPFRLRYLSGANENEYLDNEIYACLVYQLLLPTVCPVCSHKIGSDLYSSPILENSPRDTLEQVTADLLMSGVDLSNVRLRNSTGCTECGGVGVVGRTLIAEVLHPDTCHQSLRHYSGIEPLETYVHKAAGTWSIIDHALHHIELGVVDPVAAFKRLGSLRATSWKSGL